MIEATLYKTLDFWGKNEPYTCYISTNRHNDFVDATLEELSIYVYDEITIH